MTTWTAEENQRPQLLEQVPIDHRQIAINTQIDRGIDFSRLTDPGPALAPKVCPLRREPCIRLSIRYSTDARHWGLPARRHPVALKLAEVANEIEQPLHVVLPPSRRILVRCRLVVLLQQPRWSERCMPSSMADLIHHSSFSCRSGIYTKGTVRPLFTRHTNQTKNICKLHPTGSRLDWIRIPRKR